MTTLTLVTAVDPLRTGHLSETAASVRAAVSYLRNIGVEVTWSVTIDGPGALPQFHTGGHTRVVRVPVHCGVAAARNVALAHATSDWVATLDADDLLIGSVLGDVLAGLAGPTPAVSLPGLVGSVPVARSGDPSVWVVSPSLPAGGLAPVDSRLQMTRFPAGQLADTLPAGWPFHPGSVLARTDVAQAVGGWPALPHAEDLSFLLAVAEEGDGHFTPHPWIRRRSWPGQRSAALQSNQIPRGTREDLAAAALNAFNARRASRHPERQLLAGDTPVL